MLSDSPPEGKHLGVVEDSVIDHLFLFFLPNIVLNHGTLCPGRVKDRIKDRVMDRVKDRVCY